MRKLPFLKRLPIALRGRCLLGFLPPILQPNPPNNLSHHTHKATKILTLATSQLCLNLSPFYYVLLARLYPYTPLLHARTRDAGSRLRDKSYTTSPHLILPAPGHPFFFSRNLARIIFFTTVTFSISISPVLLLLFNARCSFSYHSLLALLSFFSCLPSAYLISYQLPPKLQPSSLHLTDKIFLRNSA